jgi:ribose transport system permease protein
MKRIELLQRFGLFAFLVTMCLFFSFMSPYFATWENFTNILVQSAVLIIVGAGMTLVIATAGIDLSIGSILALSSIVMAGALKAGAGLFVGVGLGILSGAAMGLINGLGVAGLGISPFIVTLGAAGIYRALALDIHRRQAHLRPAPGIALSRHRQHRAVSPSWR